MQLRLAAYLWERFKWSARRKYVDWRAEEAATAARRRDAAYPGAPPPTGHGVRTSADLAGDSSGTPRVHTDAMPRAHEQFATGVNEPFCACGRRWSRCDGSRASCGKNRGNRAVPVGFCGKCGGEHCPHYACTTGGGSGFCDGCSGDE